MVTRLLVFVGALMGLFAMHGLSDHGASSHEMNAPMTPAVVAMSHAGQAAGPAASEAADVVGSAADPGEHSSGTAMAGMCLAVLVGAAIGLVLRRPHRARPFIQAAALVLAATRLSTGRDRDPPCLFQLSVLQT